MSAKTKAIASLIAVFVLGFALCFLFLKGNPFARRTHGRPSPEKFTSSLVEKFTQELSLNDQQVEALKQQLQHLRAQHDSLRSRNNHAFEQLRDQFRTEFSKVLTPEQQIKFIEFNKREDERFKHKK